MIKIAILGASGFIGTRATEIMHLGGLAEVCPVVRSFPKLARLARFQLDCRLADALDEQALCEAFRGCDVVLHTVVGDPIVIEQSITRTYLACRSAGIRRLVYMSSASVHGQAPQSGTDESTPLHDRHELEYNNAKVRAEWQLQELRQGGGPEVVILRPGIVFGPYSTRWTAGLADSLRQGTAYLINDGRGICNSIYIDNLVRAIYLAASAKGAKIDGESFLVGDRETVTWFDLYAATARAIDLDPSEIRRVDNTAVCLTEKRPGTLERLRVSGPGQKALSYVPSRLKRSVKAAIGAWQMGDTPSPWKLRTPEQLVVTAEFAALQQCQYKLPWNKAQNLLGYEPPVSFAEACERTAGWLSFAGFANR